MSGVEFTLTDEQMKAVLGEALLAQMTGEEKDRIISQAISYLTQQQNARSGYGHVKDSPLAEAFAQSLTTFANDWCREFITEHPEIKEAVMGVIHKSAEALLKSGEVREKIGETIGNALYRSIYKEDDPW